MEKNVNEIHVVKIRNAEIYQVDLNVLAKLAVQETLTAAVFAKVLWSTCAET